MPQSLASPTLTHATAIAPGAIAIVQLHGPGCAQVVHALTGLPDCDAPAQQGRLRLCDMAGIDRGIAVVDGPWAQLMPHGGPRVVQCLTQRLGELGVTATPRPSARTRYPETTRAIEADMLATMAHAASPAAIDRLAIQPMLWRAAAEKDECGLKNIRPVAALDHLITPPSVVVVGRPNVGKSTLANAVAGRQVSIVADLPGTTRDWTGGLVELRAMTDGGGMMADGIAVRWLDTPGHREDSQAAEAVERAAIELARGAIASADVRVAMREVGGDWPTGLAHEPDLWVVNKTDRADGAGDVEGAIAISAKTGTNLDALSQAILAALGLAAVPDDALWAFSPTLRGARTAKQLADYLGSE